MHESTAHLRQSFPNSNKLFSSSRRERGRRRRLQLQRLHEISCYYNITPGIRINGGLPLGRHLHPWQPITSPKKKKAHARSDRSDEQRPCLADLASIHNKQKKTHMYGLRLCLFYSGHKIILVLSLALALSIHNKQKNILLLPPLTNFHSATVLHIYRGNETAPATFSTNHISSTHEVMTNLEN
jgi:hypothetical protein